MGRSICERGTVVGMSMSTDERFSGKRNASESCSSVFDDGLVKADKFVDVGGKVGARLSARMKASGSSEEAN